MAALTVTARGQVTLRKDLLKHLGIAPGRKIEVNKLPDGRIELQAMRAEGKIEGFIGLLAKKNRRSATLSEIDEATAAGWAGKR